MCEFQTSKSLGISQRDCFKALGVDPATITLDKPLHLQLFDIKHFALITAQQIFYATQVQDYYESISVVPIGKKRMTHGLLLR